MADAPGDRHAFSDVDQSPDPESLIAGMDAADEHAAVRALRAWGADALRLREGDSVLDVGCGLGTAAIELCDRVGGTGLIRGIDSSALMIAEAKRRAADRANVAFEVGDATSLAFAADSFHAYRSERTFQWLGDADRALTEAVRVLRPGGRIVVIDTDWGTMTVDHPDRELSERYHSARWPVPPNRWSGRRLLNQFRSAQLDELNVTTQTIVATHWEPERTAGIGGLPPFARHAQGLIFFGFFAEEEARRWLETLEDQARHDRFFVSLTMFAVAGVKRAS